MCIHRKSSSGWFQKGCIFTNQPQVIRIDLNVQLSAPFVGDVLTAIYDLEYLTLYTPLQSLNSIYFKPIYIHEPIYSSWKEILYRGKHASNKHISSIGSFAYQKTRWLHIPLLFQGCTCAGSIYVNYYNSIESTYFVIFLHHIVSSRKYNLTT